MKRFSGPEIEKQIADAFSQKVGIEFQQEFRIKTATSISVVLDLYISFPYRSFIELTLGDLTTIPNKLEQIRRVYHTFGEEIVPILVTSFTVDQKLRDSVIDIPIHFITCNQNDPNPGEQIASNIQKHMFESAPPFNMVGKWHETFEMLKILKRLSKESVERLDRLINTVDQEELLSDVLISFRPLLDKNAFEILEHEVNEFYVEYETKHYTTGALRIGRTLEFILYSLATSWGVKINKVTIKYIEDLKTSFNELENRLIDYLNAPQEQKSDTKRRLQRKNQELSDKVNALGWDIDSEHDQSTSDVIINPNSLMRDIRRKYGRHQKIREEIDLIIKQNLIGKLLDKRNDAAHADTSGSRREVEKSDLLGMINDLRTLLFHLGNIASSVRTVSDSKN